MLTAMIYPEAQQGKRSTSLATKEVSGGYLSRARAVLRASPDELAPQVLAGTKSLDAAHAEAQERKAAKATADEKMAKLARLRAEAPDLADLVREERLKLSEAFASLIAP